MVVIGVVIGWKHEKVGWESFGSYSRSAVMRSDLRVESGLEMGENKEIDRKQEGAGR